MRVLAGVRVLDLGNFITAPYAAMLLAELGADETVDYTTQPVEEAVSGVDVVLDLVGDESTSRTLGTMRDGGLFIVVPSAASLEALRELAAGRVRVTGILVEPDRLFSTRELATECQDKGQNWPVDCGGNLLRLEPPRGRNLWTAEQNLGNADPA